MGEMGALRVVATRDSAATVLEAEMRAFPRARHVEWLVNGVRAGEVEVTAEWRSYVFPLGPLALGATTVTLACRERAVVAHDVLQNGDGRALALAVGEWKVHSSMRSRVGGPGDGS
jgi:hypothetical protein